MTTTFFRPSVRLPGRWPVRFAVAQPAGPEVVVAPVRATGRIELGRVRLQLPATGPTGLLAGSRPLLGIALRDVEMVFGRDRQ